MANDATPPQDTFRSLEPKPAVTASLHFDLTQPDGEDVLRRMLQYRQPLIVLEDLDEWLRQKLKHGHAFKDANEALEAARKELHDKLEEYNVRLHES